MLLAPTPVRTAVRRTCCQGQTCSVTVRPDRAMCVAQATTLTRVMDHIMMNNPLPAKLSY